MALLAIVCVLFLYLGPVTGYRIIGPDEEDEDVKCKQPLYNVTGITTLTYAPSQVIPHKRLKRAMRRDRKLRRFLLSEKYRIIEIRKLEKDFHYYPVCKYKKMCKITLIVAHYWHILNYKHAKCWNIQPVLLTACRGKTLTEGGFSCADTNAKPGLGYRCLQDYVKQPLWVYCDGVKTSDRIHRAQIYIPFKCSVFKYCCQLESQR